MSTNIGSLAVLITGNSAGLTKELKKSEEDVHGFSRRLVSGLGSGTMAALGSIAGTVGSIFDRVAGALTSPGALIGGAITGFGLSALVVESVQLASQVEDAQASFGVMLGDAEKAKSLFADIRKLASETPLTSGGLSNLSQMLVGAGIAQDQIIPTLRMLGDLAQGDEERLKGVAKAYTDVRAKGKLSAEELNQFSEQQVSMRPALAKVMGVGEAALGELIERGKVGFPELQRAMLAMTSEGGRFFGLMETRSKTLSGLLSTLKDNVQVLGGSFGQAIIDEFGLKSMIDQLSRLAAMGDGSIDQIRPFLRDIKQLAQIAGNAMFEFLEGAAVSGAEFVNQVRDITGGMSDVLNAINEAAHWLAGTHEQFKPIQVEFEVGRFSPEKIREGFAAVRNEINRGAAAISSSGQSPANAQQAAQWKADQLAFLLGGLTLAGTGSEAIANAVVRNISAGLPDAAKQSGIDIGKALGQGVKEGLRIEVRGLTGDQLKFEQGLRDRMMPSEVFRKRIRAINDQNEIAPLGAAKWQAVGEAWGDLAKGIQQSGQQFASAMAKGSTEAYSVGIRERYSTGQQDIKQIWLQILEQEKKQAELNGKIFDQLQKAGILEVR